MLKLKFIIITVVIFYAYPVAAQDIQICDVYNSTCEKEAYLGFLTAITTNGYPELGIPLMSPFQLPKLTMLVLDVIEVTLLSGECTGIETCKVLNYETKLDNFHKIAELQCERIVIQGVYTISTDFREIFGNASGSGNGSIVLDDWRLQIKWPFKFVKRDDGEIYTEPQFEKETYVSEVQKSVTVTADNIILDDRDVTQDILCFINRYWKQIANTGIGNSFVIRALSFYNDVFGKFFDGTPASKYFSNDLNSYV